MKTVLLATDLDDTLVGDQSSLVLLNRALEELRLNNKLKLAYVTGRSFESFQSLKASQDLLIPDILICAVGTEIYIGNPPLRQKSWPKVYEWDKNQIKASLSDIADLRLQPEADQKEFSVCYFLDKPEAIGQITDRLKRYEVDVVYSGGLYLDVLPYGINKGSALKYAADGLNIDKQDVYTCGDSANDISMLEPYKSIVVANSHKELLAWAESNNRDGAYLAKSSHAAGILEGMSHYDILLDEF